MRDTSTLDAVVAAIKATDRAAIKRTALKLVEALTKVCDDVLAERSASATGTSTYMEGRWQLAREFKEGLAIGKAQLLEKLDE